MEMSPLLSCKTVTNIFVLMLADLFSLCTFFILHPLYLAYLFLLSPYYLHLFSFLSPIIFTTLLVVAVFTASAHHPLAPFPQFFGSAIPAALAILNAKLGEEFQTCSCTQVAQELLGNAFLEWEFEAMAELYKYSTPTVQTGDNSDKGELSVANFKIADGSSIELNSNKLASQENTEVFADNVRREQHKRRASEGHRIDSSTATRKGEHARKASEGLQRDLSTRKEKEWKRTLSCKLYEERVTFRLCNENAMVIDGAEQMDLLWEAYEHDSNKTDNKLKMKKKKNKEEHKVEIEDEEDNLGQLCCLQALRLSAGKMNLGVGRPNLLKVSKIFKGMGFFQSSVKRDQRRK